MLLIDGDIVLRGIEYEDADFLRHMINDPEIEFMVLGWSQPVSKRRQLAWIDSLRDNDMKLIIDLNGSAVGMASITDIDYKNSVACLNIKISQNKYRGKGIGSKTIKLLIQYGFEELNLNCLVANILEYNTASRRLFEKFGFLAEGVLRERAYKKGRYHNVVPYSLLRREYNARDW